MILFVFQVIQMQEASPIARLTHPNTHKPQPQRLLQHQKSFLTTTFYIHGPPMGMGTSLTPLRNLLRLYGMSRDR